MHVRGRLFIGGAWAAAGDGTEFTTRDPATGEVLGTCAQAGPAEADAAVDAARRALADPAWAALSAAERARLLWR
ncbi:aldehyde dehydrogenase family protein, partial [Streptomyces sp. OfavH-34-F]|uniref:aldehyde dehydrogenase family protein n=1 Tax=Streptomyces sp. OfavH-34-F TaxID=2917760 RepID=UPI001EF2D7D2